MADNVAWPTYRGEGNLSLGPGGADVSLRTPSPQLLLSRHTFRQHDISRSFEK